jgi:Uma2 family endonuclease
VDIKAVIDLTDEQFYQLCQRNRDLRFERTHQGELIILSPAGGETGNRNGRLTQQLFNWTDENATGIAIVTHNR